MKEYIMHRDVVRGMSSIVRQMAVEGYRPSLIVGMSRGGLPLGVMLSHYFDVPFKTFNKGDSIWQFYDTNVLVVDDINDTGSQLNTMFEGITPNDWIRVAVLFNNAGSSFDGVSFSGYDIDKRIDDRWIVFPWENWWDDISY